jgi:hypothetical protein
MDKNMRNALIHRDWLIKYSDKLLSDTELYKAYSETSDAINNEIIKPMVNFLYKSFWNSNKELWKHINPFGKDELSTLAHFYLLSKIHKRPVTARPIVRAIDCITTTMSKFLTNVLQRLEDMLLVTLNRHELRHLYKVVKQTIESIKNMESITHTNFNHNLETIWHVFDFKAMYTNLTPVFVQNMIEALCTKILRLRDENTLIIKVSKRTK